MVHTVSGVCAAVVLACAVTAAAQDSKPAQTPAATAKTAGQPKTLTLTGCLQRGADARTYTLTNVAIDAGADATNPTKHTTAPPAAAGTAAASTAKTAADVWTLAPDANVDFTPHVGHRVQVTGLAVGEMKDHTAKSQTSSEGSATTARGTSKSEQTAKGELTMGGHKLSVKTIKHIADTCGR